MKTETISGIFIMLMTGAAVFGGYVLYQDGPSDPVQSDRTLDEGTNATENETFHPCYISPYPGGTMAWTGYTMAGLPESEWNNTTDWDGDNISDEDEILFGTNICAWDSDFDWLTDWEEVFVYFSDPLNNDTDNDTLTDAADPAPLNASHDQDGDGVLDQFDINMWVDIQVIAQVRWNWTGSYQLSVLLAGNATDQISYSFLAGINLYENGSGLDNFTYDWPDDSDTIPVNYTMEDLARGVIYEETRFVDLAGYVWIHEYLELELRF